MRALLLAKTSLWPMQSRQWLWPNTSSNRIVIICLSITCIITPTFHLHTWHGRVSMQRSHRAINQRISSGRLVTASRPKCLHMFGPQIGRNGTRRTGRTCADFVFPCHATTDASAQKDEYAECKKPWLRGQGTEHSLAQFAT